MAYFPMFVDLSGRQVTVVGGGSVALRRSETLLYFGVDIKVIAPEIRSEFIVWIPKESCFV